MAVSFTGLVAARNPSEAGGRVANAVQKPHIPIFFGSSSDAAIEAAERHADIYALFGERLVSIVRDAVKNRPARSACRHLTARGG